ncbi:MAG: hypothetical protein P1V97_29000 [Planctomycetota bacterium]|nr:hypothetical protein [Planctomycetota bacterium]
MLFELQEQAPQALATKEAREALHKEAPEGEFSVKCPAKAENEAYKGRDDHDAFNRRQS